MQTLRTLMIWDMRSSCDIQDVMWSFVSKRITSSLDRSSGKRTPKKKTLNPYPTFGSIVSLAAAHVDGKHEAAARQ